MWKLLIYSFFIVLRFQVLNEFRGIENEKQKRNRINERKFTEYVGESVSFVTKVFLKFEFH